MHNATLTLSASPSMTRADIAAAGYLARYPGPTFEAYALDLRLFFAWAHASRFMTLTSWPEPVIT